MPAPQLSAPWQVKFTRRQGSIAIQIRAGVVKVLAPLGTPARAIHTLLEQRQDWIEQALTQQRLKLSQRPKAAARNYETGELWLFDGRHRQLQIIPESTRTTINLNEERLLLEQQQPLNPVQRRQRLQHWYQQQAEQRWPDRLVHWSTVTGLQPQGLKIRPYKSRWGSCNSRGLITLNTLLIMAPPETQDYVIIHELCHLAHPNHSPAFWQRVEQYCPTPKTHRSWLRKHLAELLF